MVRPPSIPKDLWDAIPPAAQAAVLAVFAALQAQLTRLETRVADLEAQLHCNSTNSSKPPSTTHPHAKPRRSTPKSRRAAGAQPGHPKHERDLVPTEQCQTVVPCVPSVGRRCGRALTGVDATPRRHQVWELPDLQPRITE
jgi:transposase